MRNGQFAPIGPEQFLQLRHNHGLSQLQAAALARSGIYKDKRGRLNARRIQDWENGKCRIPLANFEVFSAKLKFLQAGLSFEDVADKPLVSLLEGNIDLSKTEPLVTSLLQEDPYD